jgi:hypothetical protein
MIVNKISVGYVLQKFDTNTGKFVAQEFVSANEVSYEDENGNGITGWGVDVQSLMPEPEPYLPFYMVQPDDME